MTDARSTPSRRRHSRGAGLFALGAILVVLVATLTPFGPTVYPPVRCVICGSQGVADAASNVALFVPLGLALVLAGVRPSRSVLLASVLSAFVELMQATIVGGRDPSVGDVVFNSVGGVVGTIGGLWAWAWVRPRRREGMLLAAGALFAAFATIAITGLLLRPSLERTPWYGQWTANFGDLEVYRGRVLDARLAGREIPSRRLDDAGAARQAILDGLPLVMRVQASPPTRGLSAIVSAADDRQSRQFLLGANGPALELFVRRRANDALLVNPPLRFPDALAGVSGGDTLTLEVHRDGVRWCAGRLPRVSCLGYTAGDGWQLLQDIGVLRRHAGLVDALWMFALLFPAGYWLRGRAGAAAAVATVVLACAVVPLACGLLVSPPLEWLGAVSGLACASALAGAVRRRASEPH